MKRHSTPMPLSELREVFECNPKTGEIYWRIAIRNGIKPGQVAGGEFTTGRRRVIYKGRMYLASRLIYALHYGVDPYPLEVDHINRDPTDNRICNLRTVTSKENCANREYTNTARPGRTRPDKHTPVCIHYPDGATVTFRCIEFAAFALNKPSHHLRKYLYRDGRIFHNRVDTGMRITRVH